MKPVLLLLSLLLLGNEQILTAPSIGASGWNYSPSVAASNTNFLAAWLVRPPGMSPRFPGRIAVMPFDANGPQAKTELILDNAFGPPAVGSNGDDYLLAWTIDSGIATRHLATNGTPIGDVQTLAFSSGHLAAGGITRVLWNGVHYVVVADATSAFGIAYEIAFAGTDRHARIAEGEQFRDAATIPGLSLALSTKSRTLNGRFIDDAGNVSAPIAITSDAVVAAAVASDGSSFLAAWITDTGVLRVARIGLGGNVSPAATIAADAVKTTPPALAWNGAEFGLTWTTAQSTKYAVVTEAGASTQLQIPPAADGLGLAGANGATALVISHNLILGRIIRGSAFHGLELSEVVLDQYAPRLAGGALYYLEATGGVTPALIRQTAAGREFVINAVDYGVDDNAVGWIDDAGRVGIVLRLPNATVVRSLAAEAFTFAFASNGSTRLLVFRRGYALWTARVAADGTLLDPDGVQLTNGETLPTNVHAVWRGDDFLVEWEEGFAVKSALVAQRREVIDFAMPQLPWAVYGIAANNGKAAILWSAGTELHLGSVDPESPSPGPIVARTAVTSAAVFAAGNGFDVEWLTPDDRTGAAGAITWASPHLILYSKGSTIAQRTIAKARRHSAAAP